MSMPRRSIFSIFCFTIFFLLVTIPHLTNAALTPYVTRLFGSAKNDYAVDIAADGYNALWVVGSTTGAVDSSSKNKVNTNAGSQDVFITRFDLFGDQFFQYQYGGDSVESPTALAIDPKDDAAFIVGTTNSKEFPQGVSNLGVDDIFVTKFAGRTATVEGGEDGKPIFTVRLGGQESDTANDVAIFGDIAYVTGETESSATDLGLGESENRGSADVVLYQLSTKDGSQLHPPITMGGTKFDSGISITTDQDGNVYLLAATESETFRSGLDTKTEDNLNIPTSKGGRDLVIVKFSPSSDGGLTKAWAVRIGGDDNDYGIAIGVSPITNRLFVTGMTKSDNFPGSTSTKVKDNLFLTSLDRDTGDIRYTKVFNLMKGEGSSLAFDKEGRYVYVGGTNTGPLSRNLLLMYTVEDGELVDYGADGTTNRKERTFGIAVNGRNEVYTVGDTSASEYNEQESKGKNDATFLRWVLASKDDEPYTLTVVRNDDGVGEITSPSYDEL